jgi:hypothetical protein
MERENLNGEGEGGRRAMERESGGWRGRVQHHPERMRMPTQRCTALSTVPLGGDGEVEGRHARPATEPPDVGPSCTAPPGPPGPRPSEVREISDLSEGFHETVCSRKF